MPEEIRKKGRRRLFVQVYDKLYGLIKDGTYPEGTMLPSEAELVNMMQVSRVTVRQALALLQEDGLVKSIRGKGTVVCDFYSKQPEGMEIISNPVQACYRRKFSDIEATSSVCLVTGYLKEKFQNQSLAVLMMERRYKSEGQTKVYALSYIPVEVAQQLQLELSDQDAVLQFLEKRLYDEARNIAVQIKITDTVEFVAGQENIDENTLLDAEDVYFDSDYPYVHNKFYFISPDYDVSFNAKRAE